MKKMIWMGYCRLAAMVVVALLSWACDADFSVNPLGEGKKTRVRSVAISPASLSSIGLGSNIDFTVSFTKVVTVVGTPSLSFSIGGVTKSAGYQWGSGSSILMFRYSVAAGDSGLVAINSGMSLTLDMWGGTPASIRDEQDKAVDLALPPARGGNLSIADSIVSGISISPAVGAKLGLGGSIDLTVNLTKVVTLTGEPLLSFSIGDVVKGATYQGGHGSHNLRYLRFRYKVVAGDNGVISTTPSSRLELPMSRGVPASILALPQVSGGTVETITPSVTEGTADPTALSVSSISISPAVGAKLSLGGSIDLTVKLTKVVTLTGAPLLSFSIGNVVKKATYQWGGNSDKLVFRYTVVGGDSGVIATTSSSRLELPVQWGEQASVLTLPSASGGNVDAIAPSVVYLTISPAVGGSIGLYENITLTVRFTEEVKVTGRPELIFFIGGSPRSADYQSGSGSSELQFRYTATANDSGAISTSSYYNTSTIELPVSGGERASICDKAGNAVDLTLPSASGGNVDAIAPSVVYLTISPAVGGSIGLYENITLTVRFTEEVKVTGSPRLSFRIGDEVKKATYQWGSTSNMLVFRYTVVGGDSGVIATTSSSRLELPGHWGEQASIRDLAGNAVDLTLPSASGGNVDAIAPSVVYLTISPAVGGSIGLYENITLTVRFTEEVKVTGSPRLSFRIGDEVKKATYQWGSTSNMLVFRYTVVGGDSGVIATTSSSRLELPGHWGEQASIRDLAGNAVDLTLPSASGGNVDAIALRGTAVTISPAVGGSIGLGENIDFYVSFTKVVKVTGRPELHFYIGSDSRRAVYQSGSGSSELLFSYTVAAGDGGVIVTASTGGSLELPGHWGEQASIRDLAGNAVDLTLPSASGGNVDAIAPSVGYLTISPAQGSRIGLAEDIVLTLNFTEVVQVRGRPELHFYIGSDSRRAVYQSGSGSSELRFRYTVTANDSGDIYTSSYDTIELPVSGGERASICDKAGNAVDPTLPYATGGWVGAVRVSDISISPAYGSIIGLAEDIVLTLYFDEVVQVRGRPELSFFIGDGYRHAVYESGSDSRELRFRYTVAANDNGYISMRGSLLVIEDEASICDEAGNAVALTLPYGRWWVWVSTTGS